MSMQKEPSGADTRNFHLHSRASWKSLCISSTFLNLIHRKSITIKQPPTLHPSPTTNNASSHQLLHSISWLIMHAILSFDSHTTPFQVTCSLQLVIWHNPDTLNFSIAISFVFLWWYRTSLDNQQRLAQLAGPSLLRAFALGKDPRFQPWWGHITTMTLKKDITYSILVEVHEKLIFHAHYISMFSTPMFHYLDFLAIRHICHSLLPWLLLAAHLPFALECCYVCPRNSKGRQNTWF